MGTWYRCDECDLRFDLSFDVMRGGSHPLHQRLICRDCGAQHILASSTKTERNSRLKSASGPVIGDNAHVKFGTYVDLDKYIDLRGNIDSVQCPCCDSIGRMARDWNDNRPCPNCANKSVRVAGRYIV